ncbi:COG4223 family protein [Dichotomicrobium thermohalophilum]|uniref:Inner membrane protein n=1 Tax=Dichotomicrobium thermohalophilum TaxID=933063 RepID=A0A397P788_9HYPH|nr:hypothetical protein [Dichotomicrobium thermohalophilum]RIA45400.1 hypothetical protein BXY53_2821 [Dichotomicrobium thermohalophilum]
MSDETKSETGGSAQRPHATLDLKAERIDEPSAEEKSDNQAETGADDTEAPEQTPPPREGGSAAGFLTHLAAGLLGGLIALVVGYYAMGTFRDRLPFVSETSAEQIKAAQDRLEQRISAVAENSSEARAQLADRVSALNARTEGLAQTDEEAVASLTARVDALEQQLQTATEATDETARAEQIASVRERLAGLEESLNTVRASLEEVRAQSQKNVAAARASALAVALNNLQRAVDSGTAYATELQAVRDLSTEALEAETLAAAAQDGVPTLRDLRESFPRFANKALDAVGATGDDSIIGQIVESARSVVNVRPVGEIEGDSPSAIIARMENRLKAGDLPGVVAQSDQLSGEAAVQLLPWIEQVKTRINANKELDAMESRMLAAIQQ